MRQTVPDTTRFGFQTFEGIGTVTSIDYSHLIVRSAALHQNEFKRQKKWKLMRLPLAEVLHLLQKIVGGKGIQVGEKYGVWGWASKHNAVSATLEQAA